MSLNNNATRTLAASLATAALATPPALADDPRPADARDAATPAQQHGHAVTGAVRAPDTLARDSPTPAAPTTHPRTRDAPIVIEVTRAHGFDWTSAGIGALGGIALALIALAATSAVSDRSRPAPP